MSDDHQESLDLFDDHEEVVSEDGKKVTRKGIYLLPNLLTTASLFSGFFLNCFCHKWKFHCFRYGPICRSNARWSGW